MFIFTLNIGTYSISNNKKSNNNQLLKRGIPRDKVLSDRSIIPVLNLLQLLFWHKTYNCKANKPDIEDVLVINEGIIFPAIIFILVFSGCGRL